MVKINNVDASTSTEPILAAPQDTNERKEDMTETQSNDKAMEIIKRVLPELLERIQKLEKQVNGTEKEEEDQDDNKQLSEDDDAVAFLLSNGESNSEDDAAVDQLLAFNKKGRNDA